MSPCFLEAAGASRVLEPLGLKARFRQRSCARAALCLSLIHILLYGLNSPEFFDRSMFGNFIGLLRARGVVRVGAGGSLEFDEVLLRVAQDAQFVLSEQLRHSILQVTHG